MILGLRTKDGIRFDDFENRFGQSLESKFELVIAKLLKAGLLLRMENSLILSEKGLDANDLVTLRLMDHRFKN